MLITYSIIWQWEDQYIRKIITELSVSMEYTAKGLHLELYGVWSLDLMSSPQTSCETIQDKKHWLRA